MALQGAAWGGTSIHTLKLAAVCTPYHFNKLPRKNWLQRQCMTRIVNVRMTALLQEVALQRTAWDQISRHMPQLLSLQRLRKLLLSDNGLQTLPQVLPQLAQQTACEHATQQALHSACCPG